MCSFRRGPCCSGCAPVPQHHTSTSRNIRAMHPAPCAGLTTHRRQQLRRDHVLEPHGMWRCFCTGMDFYVVLDRPGYRVSRRRRAQARVGIQHRLTKEDAIKWCETLASDGYKSVMLTKSASSLYMCIRSSFVSSVPASHQSVVHLVLGALAADKLRHLTVVHWACLAGSRRSSRALC